MKLLAMFWRLQLIDSNFQFDRFYKKEFRRSTVALIVETISLKIGIKFARK